ncbi:MAG: SPOR domain-containing protein [Candidatus Marithrix sp.]|nr:SPOR domain-containing protein [Candidatus Marithrix sp.]
MANNNKHLRSNYDDSTSCPPGWAWLLAGIIIGIFISFLIYLQELAPHSLPPEHAQVVPVTDSSSPVKTSERFDFYDILPGHEIKIPAKNSGDKNEERPLEITVKGEYLLQVGLFKRKSEAKSLKKYLFSLGIQTDVVQAPFSSTEYGYRVQVGPFSELKNLNQTRALLTENNISSILLKLSTGQNNNRTTTDDNLISDEIDF